MTKRVITRTAGWFRKATLLACLAGSAGLAHAQPPQPTAARVVNDKNYTRDATFSLPVEMDQRTRDSLKEVRLFVKSGAGDWVRQEVAPPAIRSFPYTVPQDGEYWFTLMTVDRQGKTYPSEPGKDAPILRVVVDRRPPSIDVQPCTNQAGEFCLRCTVQDANPDSQSLRVVHLTDQGEKALEPVPGMAGVFRPANAEMLGLPVRVSASDLCGNKSSREIMVKDLIASLPKPNPVSNPVTTISGHLDPRLPMDTKNNPPLSLPKDPVAPVLVKDPLPPVLIKEAPALNPVLPNDLNPNPRINDGPKLPAVGGGQGPMQILNTTRASIEYRIDQVGPSGVGKVEIYVTTDKGATWQKIGEDHDRRSPAEVDLPGEGVYGIRLAVTNGNGFGGTAPQRGDQPTCWIEVDLTCPFVQLRPIEPVAQNGALEIRWSATDKNLGPEPVSLFYRARAEGAWQPIARNIKNDGVYRWNFPRDLGPQFFLRVEVTDLAGNLARADTPNAILLDMTEPHAQVIGVSGINPR